MASNKLRTGLLCLSLVLITYSVVELWHVSGKRSRTGMPALGELSIAVSPVPTDERAAVTEPFDAPRGEQPSANGTLTSSITTMEQAVTELRPAIDRSVARKREKPSRPQTPTGIEAKKEAAENAVVLAMTADTAVIGIRGGDGEVTTRLVRVGDRLAQYGEVTAIKLGQGEVATNRARIRVEY